MANIGLFWANRADDAAVTGGGWAAAFPASNVGTRSYAEVARSTNALTTNTQLRLDHGAAVPVRAVAVVAHNLSDAALVRWSRGTTSGGNDVYAGAWVDAWRFTPSVYSGRCHAWIFDLGSTYTARYDLLEIDDTANPDGYVQIGRVFVDGAGFIPTINAQYGLQDGLRDLSATDRSDSGALWVTARRTMRTVSCVMPRLDEDEGDEMHEMMRVCGTGQEVLYLPEMANTPRMQRYGFLGTLDEMSPLEYPLYRNRSVGLRLTES